MPSAERRSRLPLVGPTFYGFNANTLYSEFHILTTAYHWALVDVKALPVRERRYWIRMVRWKMERQEWQSQTSRGATPI